MKIYLYTVSIFIALINNFNTEITKPKTLKVGDKIPVFSSVDNHGNSFDSTDYIGKQSMVIFFYPKDNAPVCTAQVCSFRDSFNEFQKLNVKIIGISTDHVVSHNDFSKKHKLPYILITDFKKRIQNLFGINNGFLGLAPQRITFIANKKGIIISVFKNHKEVEMHTKSALIALKSI